MRTPPLLPVALVCAIVALGLSGCSPPATGGAQACGDGLVRAYADSLGGTAPDAATTDDPQAGFDPADALAGLDVRCSVVFVAPSVDGAGDQQISFAVVAGGEASVADALRAFAAEQGYVVDAEHPDDAHGFEIWQRLEGGDDGGPYPSDLLLFSEVDEADIAAGYEAIALEAGDDEPGDWLVAGVVARR